jgi:CHAT domain
VHFFCHGTTTFAKPRLELATLTDTATSSIELDLPDLVASTGVRESWLTVLNCCESGAASRDVHSLSHSLVMRGLNAVIGMKEAVSELDAFEFSGRLYPGLFELLRTTLTPLAPGDEAVVDWATVMWAPRKGLRDRHKANVAAHEWTLPVLYVRPDVFRVKRAVPVSPEARARTPRFARASRHGRRTPALAADQRVDDAAAGAVATRRHVDPLGHRIAHGRRRPDARGARARGRS